MANVNFTRGDICWTTTPYTEKALREMPYVNMIGYQQTWSDAIQSINYWMTRFLDKGKSGNPYKGLYLGDKVSEYRLPYFNEYHHNISQSWQENQGPAGELVKKITNAAETVGKAILPAAGILFPKSYAGNTAASYQFSFTLINTCDGDGGQIKDNIKKNKKFIHNFINDNLHAQNNSLSVSPPLIYEVLIPGIRWSPAAVVAGLTINNKGTMNLGNAIGLGEYIYPDAWEIQITVQELINESRNIYADAIREGGMGNIQVRIF